MTKIEYTKLLTKTLHHKKEINLKGYAGCFSCISWFSKDKIKEWVDDGDTALCPKCRLDNVMPIDLNEHESMLLKFKEMNDFQKK